MARQIGAGIFTIRTANCGIAAMLGFRDTGTEAALRLGLADVGVRIRQKNWHQKNWHSKNWEITK
jgi:hypothetical protein